MSDHDHDHGHDHDAPDARAARRVTHLIATLEARGVTSEAEIEAMLHRFLAGAGPSNGARIVARAWRDPAFKARLLTDANAAIAELGLDLSHWAHVVLRVVENTPEVHNVIVCTLCSCYPLALLGPSPTWYKSEAYRARVVREPRAVIREFGYDIPATTAISVWDSTADLRYLVLPMPPPGSESLDEAQLASLVTRDALIGVAMAG
jgi:nitrile hydratase